MARDDWYRNTTWNADVEANFQQRLRRVRDKSQYLRIQASYLAESDPQVALGLLDQYFALGDHFDMAQAHVDRARVLRALNDVDGTILSYEAALEREYRFPHLKTQAYLDFACLIVEMRIARLYIRALEVLDAHRERPTFPVDRYRANGARALLLQELGRTQEACAAANLAMAAASEAKSGFRYHQQIGLVRSIDDAFGQRVSALAT